VNSIHLARNMNFIYIVTVMNSHSAKKPGAQFPHPAHRKAATATPELTSLELIDPDPSDKHTRILYAAIEVFAEYGYFQARISDIAVKAGVADGTIYLYFKNKEQILMAALDFAFHRFMKVAKEEMKTIHGPRERLMRLAELHLEKMGENRGIAVVFQTEVRQSARFLKEFSHKHLVEYFDLVRSIVQEGQQQGIFRKEVSDKIAANCIFGALDAMVTSWLLSEKDYRLGHAAPALMDVVLTGLEVRK
jgi:TetR/AcrR family fatty acid metabolism transcriptional regulator